MYKDTIFSKKTFNSGSFKFNDSVAEVFADMLNRSIPGYESSIEIISHLAKNFVQPNTQCYDLGCSLGAASLAMSNNIIAPGCQIIAVDSSQAMTKRCKLKIKENKNKIPISVECKDIRKIQINNASIVVMNYTLQFIPIEQRNALISKIYKGIIKNGIFVISEKICEENTEINNLLTKLHYDFKKNRAYSEIEIHRKRKALENVLIPEHRKTHIHRLKTAGFKKVFIVLQHINFLTLVGIK